jgi:hypothetical protein
VIIMKLPRRQLLDLAVGTAALATISGFASAQSYPERPVRIVSGFPQAASMTPTLA